VGLKDYCKDVQFEQLIRDVFWEEDAVKILAIPIQPGQEDVIAWHFVKKEVFSVKSSYHVLEYEV